MFLPHFSRTLGTMLFCMEQFFDDLLQMIVHIRVHNYVQRKNILHTCVEQCSIKAWNQLINIKLMTSMLLSTSCVSIQ